MWCLPYFVTVIEVISSEKMKIPEFVKTLTKPCLAFFFHFFFSAAATIKAQLKGLLTTFAAEDTWPVL